jgi:predicted nucleic-acid-binding protein
MPSVDTNVLVRWLVEDDTEQVARVRRIFNTAIQRGDVLFVPSTVALELEWVLRSRYQLDKTRVLQVFNALLETQELEFQAESAIEQALHLYRSGTAEFADCLHAGLCAAANQLPMLTFDKKAAKLPGVKMVEA